jgi:hypothetical protein
MRLNPSIFNEHNNQGFEMEKNKWLKFVFCILFCAFVIFGCTNYKQNYISVAKEILKENGLSGEVEMEFDETKEGYDFYNLIINSEGYENKSYSEKILIINKLDEIQVDDSKIILLASVFSHGNEYNLFGDDLWKNDIPIITKTSEHYLVTPPKKVNIVSTKPGLKFALAADTISNLSLYEMYDLRTNNSPQLRRIYSDGYAFFIMKETTVLLLEIDGEFAKIEFLEGHFKKKAGDIAWIRRVNLSSN